MIEEHDIGWAVKQLQDDKNVCRAGWNGKGMWLYYVHEDKRGVNRLPYVVMVTAQGDHVPWLCSQIDLLATDWELAK